MARPVSPQVIDVRRRLVERLGDGLHRPGDRFLSNRAIARQYGVSYQTADRLLRQLVDEGLLERRSQSGTYVPGRDRAGDGPDVLLCFDARARRRGSFGARLLELLIRPLIKSGLNPALRLVEPGALVRILPHQLPVLWECPRMLAWCEARRRRAVVLNDRPSRGVASTHIDSISVDDFGGGACAAQVLQERFEAGRFCVIAGPRGDRRSDERVAGFCSVQSEVKVVHASGWDVSDGAVVAGEVFTGEVGAVFCCNDRLAEAVLGRAAVEEMELPPLVGFDDAPVAARLGLSTIALPWERFAGEAVEVIARRTRGDTSVATRRVIPPQPVLRRT